MPHTSEVTLRVKFLLAITSRYGITTINLLLIALSILTLRVMFPMIFDTDNNTLELENISEYMGVILIGYGVAVEERQSFMGIFKLYPAFKTTLQKHVDHLCHEYGLCYLLLGLFMEICVACIKIPNVIIDTNHIEFAIFSFSAVFLAWNTVLMLRHCWFLFRSTHTIS
jgi:hypothetical protein